MAKTSGGVRKGGMTRNPLGERDYYAASKRIRTETLKMADKLKGNPLIFVSNNGIRMNVEITKSDIKTIVGKNTTNNKFNAIKNKLAQDIKGFIEKGTFEGWRDVISGKHKEAVYFAYYSRNLGARAYLCIRKMRSTGMFKPYAIIDEKTFNKEIGNLKKRMPPK